MSSPIGRSSRPNRPSRITVVPESELSPTIRAARRTIRLRQYARQNPQDGFDVPARARRNMPALRPELAPGGSYDATAIGDRRRGSQTVWRAFTPGVPVFGTGSRHDYAVLSDPLPAGTTFAQANAALQRFNAPTADAWRGRPGTGTEREQVVTTSNGIPAGRVTVQRGEGWIRNTTVDGQHILRGSITRRIIRDDDGQFRILTEGVGRDGALGNARHAGNALGGPGIFASMDEITIRWLQQQQR